MRFFLALALAALPFAVSAQQLPAPSFRQLTVGGSTVTGVGTAAGTVAAGNDSRITGAAQKANNLSDLTNPIAARSNLGLGTALTSVANGSILSNLSGSTGVPAANSLSSILDARIGDTRGTVAVRGVSGWTALTLGAAGTTLQSNGADLVYATSSPGAGSLRYDTSQTLTSGEKTQAQTNIGLLPTSVAITGGTINGTTVGGTSRAAGAFTTLAANSIVTLSSLPSSDPASAGVLWSNGGTVMLSGASGAWTDYTPVATPAAGAITSYTSAGRYRVVGKTVWFTAVVTITNKGTGSGALQITVPVGTAAGITAVAGFETTAFRSVAGYIAGSSNYVRAVYASDAATPIVDTASAIVSGSYEMN
jgi:hypothetical protein